MEDTEPGIVLAIGIFTAVTVVQSIGTGPILSGVLGVFCLLAVSLGSRFVRAHERLADALEADATLDAEREPSAR